MSTIYTRAGKGSALTWTEGDANITNLNNDKIENIVEDITPQLGGNLDVNGKTITNTLSIPTTIDITTKDITLTPGNIGIGSDGKVIISGLSFPSIDGTNTQVLTTDGAGQLYWSTSATGPAGYAALSGFTTTATAAGITLLTSTSSVYQIFTGSATQTIRLPDTSTLSQGWTFHIVNNSTGSLTLQTFTSAALYTILPGLAVRATCLSISTNIGTAWEPGVTEFSSVTGTGSVVLSASPTFTGTVAAASISASGLISASQGVLATSSGAQPKLTVSNTAQSASAWTTGGQGLKVYTAIYTDQTSTGTIASSQVHAIAPPTLASTNVITVTDAGTLYVAGPPTAGTNTTITNGWAILANGNVKANSFTSSVATGTAPFTVASTTKVTNLNVEQVDGYHADTANTVSTIAVRDGSGIITASGFAGALNGSVGATTPNTGAFSSLSFKNPIEAIFNLGTTGGTVAPDPANGSVQKITLNSALTINGFTNATAGESLTLIIYGGTAYTSITSTMKFAGGDKTLTATAGCIDILSIYYDGTTYFASIGKGFA